VTDDAWDKQRSRAIMAAFQTGRPVFADTDGEMRYVDGDREKLSEDVGVPKAPLPQATSRIYTKAMRASRAVFVGSIVAAGINLVAGLWHPWHYAAAGAMLCSALIWRRVHQGQRALYGSRK